jgi:riboflavin transporter FmnP
LTKILINNIVECGKHKSKKNTSGAVKQRRAEGVYMTTKKITTLAILAAIAYITMFFLRLPIMPSAPMLKYDPNDIIIVIGGFLFGPLAAMAVSFVVAFAEMVTVSTTGPIGMVMNVLSSAAFACTASVIYKYKHNLWGAVAGLVAGCLTATAVMLLWNYIMTPIYMGVPRPVVAGMLMPVFLPFNLVKTGLNAAVALLLYKPLVNALRRTGLHDVKTAETARLNKGLMATAAFVLVSIVMVIVVLQGVI